MTKEFDALILSGEIEATERLDQKISELVLSGRCLTRDEARDLFREPSLENNVVLILIKDQNGSVLEVRKAKAGDFDRRKKEAVIIDATAENKTIMEFPSNVIIFFYIVEEEFAQYFL